MKKNGFTLSEALIAIILIGTMVSVLTGVMRPNNVKKEIMQKAGVNLYIQIDFATKQILAKNSLDYSMQTLRTTDGTSFSLSSANASSKLSKLYKKYLGAIRKKDISSSYSSGKLLTEKNTQVSTYKVSSFTDGFFLKNGSYMAFKLNSNCTSSTSYVYNPSMLSNRNAVNVCGLIFFDINGQESPNIIGVDQYIVPIGKYGVK